ncbi:hypothetical protein ACFL03_15300 [Thermodesulfobacteriota bacterium]
MFDEKTKKHIIETILPTANGILKALGLPEKCFELSVVNLGAASIVNIGLSISGFSADVPIALALLSADLQLAVPNDFIFTGHVASPVGDIRMVKGIPAKVTTAIEIDAITTFVHPALDQDNSLGSLTSAEKQRVSDALTKAKRDIRTIAVSDISDLVREVFSDEQVVLASFRNRFYKASVPLSVDSPVVRAVKFFVKGNEQRFWKVLENQMLAGKNDKVKELLLTLTSFHIHRKTYPKGLGSSLLKLVHSLPPETHRLKIDFPLLAMTECIKLGQLAHESDHEDVRLLFSASFGDKAWHSTQKVDWQVSSETLAGAQDERILQSILSEIDSEALAKFIGQPIDVARATYIMDTVIVKSSDEFNHTIASFYVHLLRHTRKVPIPVDFKAAGAEAFALLERAFSQKGGLPAALEEAKNAINGGLRLIFDLMTDQLRREEQEKHINGVLKLVMDPLDWDGKVALMGEVLRRLEPHLPPEIILQPPERFAAHYESIVRAYVQSMDQVKLLFRSF